MEVKRVINKKSIIYCLLVMAFILGYYLYCQNGKLTITDDYGDSFTFSKNDYYTGYSDFFEKNVKEDTYIRNIQKKRDYYLQINMLYSSYYGFKDNPDEMHEQIEALGYDKSVTDVFWSLVEKDAEFAQSKEWNRELSYINELIDKHEVTKGYDKKIEQIITNSDEMLKMTHIIKEDSFIYNSILKTKDDYEKVTDVKPILVNDYAVKSVLDISVIPYLIFVMALVIPVSFLDERKNGLWNIVHQSVGGRTRLSLIRSAICLLSSVVLSVITYIALFVLSFYKFGGMSVLKASVQSVAGFERCVYKLSTGWMLLAIAVLIGLAVGVLTNLASMFLELFRGVFLGYMCLLVTIVGSWLMYTKITDQMAVEVLKYCNFASILDASSILSKYLNIRIGNSAVFRPSFEIVYLLISGLVLICLNILIANKVKPVAGYNRLVIIIKRMLVIKEKLVEMLSWGLKEAYYQLFVNKAIIVVAVAIFLVFDLKIYTGIIETQENYLLDEVYAELKGDYSEKESLLENKINELNQSISNVENEYEKAKEAFLAGEMDEKEVLKYYLLNQEVGLSRGLSFRLTEQKKYLDKNKNSDVWIVDNRGYELWMNSDYAKHLQLVSVIGIVGTIFITAFLYEEDKKKGLYDIIQASAGRKSHALLKRSVLGVMVFSLSFSMFLIDFILMSKTFSLSGFGASIYSIKKWSELPVGMPIWTFVILVIMGKAAFMTLISQLGLSLVKKYKAVVSIVVMLIILLPYLFTVVGWNGFKTVDISRLFIYFENYFAGV